MLYLSLMTSYAVARLNEPTMDSALVMEQQSRRLVGLAMVSPAVTVGAVAEETGTETVHEFAVSANKVFRYSGTMYMIVPNNEVLNIVREYILKWEEAERRKPRIKRVVRFCASTFEDMRYGLGTKDTSGKGKPSVPQWKFAREFAPAPDGETENRMKGEET